MKLSDITAKLTCSIRTLNGRATRTLGVAALAAATLATVPAAHAQRFAIGVQFGGARYYEPLPPPPPPRFAGSEYGYGYGHGSEFGYGFRPGPGYWEHRREEEWRRREWFRHHEGFYGRPY